MHELEVHHVGLEVGHGIGELGKGRLKRVEGKSRVAAMDALAGRLAKRRAGGGAQRRGRARGVRDRAVARRGSVLLGHLDGVVGEALRTRWQSIGNLDSAGIRNERDTLKCMAGFGITITNLRSAAELQFLRSLYGVPFLLYYYAVAPERLQSTCSPCFQKPDTEAGKNGLRRALHRTRESRSARNSEPDAGCTCHGREISPRQRLDDQRAVAARGHVHYRQASPTSGMSPPSHLLFARALPCYEEPLPCLFFAPAIGYRVLVRSPSGAYSIVAAWRPQPGHQGMLTRLCYNTPYSRLADYTP